MEPLTIILCIAAGIFVGNLLCNLCLWPINNRRDLQSFERYKSLYNKPDTTATWVYKGPAEYALDVRVADSDVSSPSPSTAKETDK